MLDSIKVLKPEPDRIVRSENPWTFQLYSLFRVKNRSMQKKVGTHMDRGLTTRFCEPWPTFEVQTVSLFFSFSDEFWPIHWYEVMIISRRNERIQRKTKIGRRYDNFRSWTKGFVREKKKRTSEEKEDKFLQKKRERRTQRSRICSKTNSTLAQQINSKHKLHQIKQTKTQITVTRIFLFKCCFFFFFLLFFLLLFLFSVDGAL